MAKQIIELPRNRQLYFPGFTLSPVGLVANKSLSQEEWERAGEVLGEITKRCMWFVGDWYRIGSDKGWGEKYDDCEERFGIAVQTATDALAVSKHIEFSRRREKLSWSHHKEVAWMPPREQDKWLDLAEEHGWSRNELRDAIKAAKPAAKIESEPGKFRVLYADPPWKYSDQLIDGYGAAEHHYPTMDIDDLCKMNVSEVAASNAVLFIWTTSPMLDDTFPVIQAWGFEYKTSFVWDKVKHNYGHYNSVRHELLLICTRGSCVPDSSTLRDSVIVIERDDKHSRKPVEFYDLIEELYTRGPYLELFAREKRDGWESFGNEL